MVSELSGLRKDTVGLASFNIPSGKCVLTFLKRRLILDLFKDVGDYQEFDQAKIWIWYNESVERIKSIRNRRYPYEIKHPKIRRILVYFSAQRTAAGAAKFIVDFVKKNPTAVISYATGQSKILLYQIIARKVSEGEVSFAKTKAFHLDEYYPCDSREQYSFVNYLNGYVFKPFKIRPENVFTLNGLAKDPQEEADRYNKLLLANPIDLSILGIGPGGHIGFNEPGTSFTSWTHLVNLSKETIHRNKKERGEKTPPQALTQGIANILSAKKIILVAYGSAKYGQYLAPALKGEIELSCPASALRLAGEVVLFIDLLAAQKLTS